jgi:hypothetical protein
MNPNAIKLELSASMDQESVAEVKGIVNELNGALSAANDAIDHLTGRSLNVDIVINKHMVEKEPPTVEELAVTGAANIRAYCVGRGSLCLDYVKGKTKCPFYIEGSGFNGDNHCLFAGPPTRWGDPLANLSREPRS